MSEVYITAAEAAEIIGMPLNLFKKLGVSRRPPRQDDGTFKKEDVIEWYEDRLSFIDDRLNDRMNELVTKVYEHEIEQNRFEQIKEKFEFEKRSAILMPIMPWFNR